jgi:curved DNA-binding protein CbpA
MTKKYYETLGVSEKATSEELKKAYRKLALKWHPDKFATKNLEEKEQANEKMQEINRAFEILGDEDKRKKYDLGITDFPSDTPSYQYDYKEEVRKQEEKLRRKEGEIIDLELEILKLEMKALDRSSTLNEIGAAFNFTFPQVNKEDLDPSLWQPYGDWMKKVVEMPITIPKGKQRSEELENFKKEMIKVIKETETALKIREENKRKQEREDDVNSGLNRARKDAFEYIEKDMTEKGLKTQDLGEYANYQAQINNLDKVYKIRDLREEVLSSISKLGRKPRQPDDRRDYPPRDPRENPDPDRRFPDKPEKPRRDERKNKEEIETEKIDNFISGFRDNKYDNWTHQELVEEIKREQLNNASLQKLVSISETRINELEEEIRELKAELPQTSQTRQGIFEREKQINQWKQSQVTLNSVIDNNNNNNKPFPIIPIISGVGIIALLVLIVYKLRKNRVRR